MKAFLDITAAFVLLLLGYILALWFFPLPDIGTTFVGRPGGLVALPIFYLWFTALRHQFRVGRPRWLVSTLLIWPLSAIYHFRILRKDLAGDARQMVQADGHAPGQ